MYAEAVAAATIEGTRTQILAFAIANRGGFSVWTTEDTTAPQDVPSWEPANIVTARAADA